MSGYDQICEAAEFIVQSARLRAAPDVAVVLGSGLGGFASGLQAGATLTYQEIPHWPESNVAGHEGKLVIGQLSGRTVAALAGRVHLYEGYDLRTVTFATRVVAMLGVKTVILTNAAGGINTSFSSGTLMVIDDHINLMGSSPLMGPNDDRLGPRFPDMTTVYSPRLRQLAHEAGGLPGRALPHGIYAAVHGPSYETPAEIRYLRTIGADAVGMSTVPEALVARHMGIEVLGISCIANMAAGMSALPPSHEEVLETTRRVRGDLTALLEQIIARL